MINEYGNNLIILCKKVIFVNLLVCTSVHFTTIGYTNPKSTSSLLEVDKLQFFKTFLKNLILSLGHQ